MNTRTTLDMALSAICALAFAGSAQAMPSQLGYSGRLYDANANAIAGAVDLKVTLYSGGSAIGAAQEFSDTQVVDGFFTVLLEATDEILAILSNPAADTVVMSFEVRMHGGGSYQVLAPPQPLVPSAWALASPPLTSVNWTADANTLSITEPGSEHSVAVGPFNAPLAVSTVTVADANGSNFPHGCLWYGARTTGTEQGIWYDCPAGTYAFSGSCRTDGKARMTDCGAYTTEMWHPPWGAPSTSRGWQGWWDSPADPTLTGLAGTFPAGASRAYMVEVLCCRY